MKITKSRTAQLELWESDIQVLSDICEMARRYMSGSQFDKAIAEYGEGRINKIKDFLQAIFDI